jgi:hypothetical protein
MADRLESLCDKLPSLLSFHGLSSGEITMSYPHAGAFFKAVDKLAESRTFRASLSGRNPLLIRVAPVLAAPPGSAGLHDAGVHRDGP